MNTEIYFDDLNDEKQEELLNQMGVDSPEQVNMDVFPLAVTNLPNPDGGNP